MVILGRALQSRIGQTGPRWGQARILHTSTLLNWQYQYGTPYQYTRSQATHCTACLLLLVLLRGNILETLPSLRTLTLGLFSVLVTAQDASQVVNTSECGVSGEWCPPLCNYVTMDNEIINQHPNQGVAQRLVLPGSSSPSPAHDTRPTHKTGQIIIAVNIKY